jgi:hypothetical protein
LASQPKMPSPLPAFTELSFFLVPDFFFTMGCQDPPDPSLFWSPQFYGCCQEVTSPFPTYKEHASHIPMEAKGEWA